LRQSPLDAGSLGLRSPVRSNSAPRRPQRACLCLTRFAYLLDFRDDCCVRGLFDHLNSNRFDCWSNWLLHFLRSFLHWRTFGLGPCNRPLRSLRYLTWLTACSRLSFWQFSSLLYFCSLLTFSHDPPRSGWWSATHDVGSKRRGNGSSELSPDFSLSANALALFFLGRTGAVPSLRGRIGVKARGALNT
jgi:hypothetical protein